MKKKKKNIVYTNYFFIIFQRKKLNFQLYKNLESINYFCFLFEYAINFKINKK